MIPLSTRRLCVIFIGLVGAASGVHAEDLDSVMYRDPAIPVARVVKAFPPGLADLWLPVLERPERDMRCRAALAIAQAHEGGLPGMAAAVPRLLHMLDRTDDHPAVLAAAARALVVLDARDAAPHFLTLAKSGDSDIRDIVEPALARWDYKPARDLWLSRLAMASPYRHDLLEAIRHLGTVREERAAPRLRELALSSDAAAPVRLAAARALAEIRTSGLESDAVKLSGDTSPAGMTPRLVAANLLRRHKGDEAIRVLQTLARSPEPAVALAALTRMTELGTVHVLPVMAEVMRNQGAEVRMHGVAAMIDHPSDDHVRSLARIFSDPHPDVRIQSRKGLHKLASERRALIIELAVKALNASEWRAQEQAAILLGQLDHKPAAERMVKLLDTNRSEVAIAVGWGLRQLAVAETLPPVLDHIKRRHAALLRVGHTAGLRGVTPDALDKQLSQLAQFIGQARYRPADPALQALVPRILKGGMPPVFTPVGPETRAAAIWALGHINEGNPEPKMVASIESRLTGDGLMGRDDARVRSMAAIALARFQAKTALKALREYADGTAPTVDITTNACRVALGLMTNEPVPPPGEVKSWQQGWFLVPLK
ncbi:MAG TPA: HEAT repeat domain-containing protein [Gemmata sp.]|nr:HEAT repeat domain-containing protein [Gemmata sp.]